MEAVAGIVQFSHGIYHALNHVEFVIHWHLHGDGGQGGAVYGWSGEVYALVAEVEECQDEGVQSVNRQPEDNQRVDECQENHVFFPEKAVRLIA